MDDSKSILSINFDVDINDVSALYTHYVKNSYQWKKYTNITGIAIPVIFAVLFLFLLVGNNWFLGSYWNLLYILLIIASISCSIFKPRNAVKNLVKEYMRPGNDIYFGKTVMTFDEEGLKSEKISGVSSNKWESIYRIWETPDYFFLYVSTVSAYSISKNKINGSEVSELKNILARFVPQSRIITGKQKRYI